MKLTNVGTKVLNVGSVVLMPGESGLFAREQVDVPAVHVLCGLGYLTLEEEPEKSPEPEAVPEEKPEEPVSEEETPKAVKKTAPKKGGRAKKTEE